MSAVTADLHNALVSALGRRVVRHSNVSEKPLSLDLALPLPPRLRIYMYSLVVGGTKRPGEFKVVVRVPGQVLGQYGSFDHSGNRLALLIGYSAKLDVFVLWDASLHPKFKYAGNIQVRAPTVHKAAALGYAREARLLSSSGLTEVVIACQSGKLAKAIDERVSWTGDQSGHPWVVSQT